LYSSHSQVLIFDSLTVSDGARKPSRKRGLFCLLFFQASPAIDYGRFHSSGSLSPKKLPKRNFSPFSNTV